MARAGAFFKGNCRRCKKYVAPEDYYGGMMEHKECALRHAKKMRIQWRLNKYGLTFEEYEKFMGDLRCQICRRKTANRLPAIDHDHNTGKMRGVLCFSCNVGIGNFREDPKLLRRAARYLESTRASV